MSAVFLDDAETFAGGTVQSASPSAESLEPPAGSPFASSTEQIGYIPPPLDDEPLDGFLEHLAYGMRTDPMNLRRHFNLPVRLALGAVAPLGTDQVQRLQCALGFSEATLRAMTLERFAHLELVPHPQTRGLPAGAWPRGRGARYCPECLVERGLRWRLSWYLTWTFVCIQHRRVLLGDCPTCHLPVRSSAMGHPRGFHTGLRLNAQRDCACPVEGLSDADEHLTPPTPPELLEPVMRAQRTINGVLTGQALVQSLGVARPGVEWLRDVATLVRLLVCRLDPVDIGLHLGGLIDEQPALERPQTPSDTQVGARVPYEQDSVGVHLGHLWAEAVRLPDNDRPTTRLSATVHSPVITALSVTAAVHVLANDSVAKARHQLSNFPTRGQASTGEFVSKYGSSWELATVLRRESDSARPGATLAVRLVASRFTASGQRRRPLPASKVPASLWPELLAEVGSVSPSGYQSCAASTGLLAIASNAAVNDAFSSLDLSPRLAEHLRRELASMLDLDSDRHNGSFARLLLIHDFLSGITIPIDYARRRRTFKEVQRPSRRLARRVADESGLRQTERLTAFMGWHVHELLTGNDILLSEQCLDLLAGHRRAYTELRQRWRQEPPPTLLRVAERALQVNHLDEPITWAPKRLHGGTLIAPAAYLDRQLNGWDKRPSRGESRQLVTLNGQPMPDVVALAENPSTFGERRLRTDLARFWLVAEARNMSTAARQLRLHPGTFSSSTRRLEQRLGHVLFLRTSRGLIPTQHGHQLHRLVTKSSIEPSAHART